MAENEKKAKNQEVGQAGAGEKPVVKPDTSVVKKSKKDPKKKPNIFVRIGKRLAKWARDFRSEAKKIVWPTGKQVLNNTVVVIIAVIIVCAIVYVLDVTFGYMRDMIASLGR